MTDAYRWVAIRVNDSVPAGALRGGTDLAGEEIYVARAFHKGDLLPGKFVPARVACYVCYEGQEVQKDQLEVLVPAVLSWENAKDGNVPFNAVASGETVTGEKLYTGRVTHDGVTTPGKIHPSHGTCYYPYNGKEFSSSEYECLILV